MKALSPEEARLRTRLRAVLKPGLLGTALEAHRRAKRLYQHHRRGDPLAVFECLTLWREEGLPYVSLPDWAIEAWGALGAQYFEQRLTAHVERRKNPSFERIAGLGGVKKKRDPLSAADRKAKAAHVQAVYEEVIAEARGVPKSRRRWLTKGRFPSPQGSVSVLNASEKPTQLFQVALGKRFGITGNSDNAIYREVRRFLKIDK